MYLIEITEKSEKFLKKLDYKEKEIILRKINSIRENPFSHIKKLKGTKFWRLIIIKCRAILDINVTGKKITVISIGYRKNIYK